MSKTKHSLIPATMAAMAALASMALNTAMAAETDFSGQLRALLNSSTSNNNSLMATASQLAPGLPASSNQSGVLESELRASYQNIHAVATLQGQADGSGHSQATGWLNELYGGFGDGAWQFSAGKKTIAWDVGYGYRPNDVIAQEKRRSLISTTTIGKPLLSVDYFTAKSSLSLVWVNPGHTAVNDIADVINAVDEQALAARWYQHSGGVDLHGFARYGQHSGGSLGAALSWVATDEMEVHASLRYQKHSGGLRMAENATLIQRSTPWQNSKQENVVQAMFGLNYTTESQHSFFLEAWWDGTALSDREWQNWNRRNQALRDSINYLPQLQQEIGYNLAWQSQALSASSNIRRQNLFARWSWQKEAWQPSLDILWTPEDRGRVITAALGWQGDRLSINGGLRQYGGPARAVFAQLPVSRSAYVSATWAF